MEREALKLALEALQLVSIEWVCNGAHHAKKDRHQFSEPCPIVERYQEAITAIKEALEQPAQEPVACARCKDLEEQAYDLLGKLKAANLKWSVAHPWVGLTDEDKQKLAAAQFGWEDLCLAVEAKLKEKNNGT